MTSSPAPPYRRSLLRQERSINTRRTILRAGARLWATQGFDATTIEDICREAGIGRSTYYLYFESKDHLLIELARATARGVSREVDAWVSAGSVDDAIAVFISGLVRRMEDVPRSLTALVMRRVAAANVTARPVAGDPVLFDDILGSIVRDGQRRGELRVNVDAREVGEALAALTLDALERWAGGDDRQPLRFTLEFRISLVIDALRSVPVLEHYSP
jgi:AcrR family transcriptional regulator